MMQQPFIPFISCFAADKRLCAGRVLFSLICALLLVMPWTEHYWTFDKFLRGGQDSELGIFALLCFLCLVLVLSKRLPRHVDAQLARAQSQSSGIRPPLPAASRFGMSQTLRLTISDLLCNVQLQI